MSLMDNVVFSSDDDDDDDEEESYFEEVIELSSDGELLDDDDDDDDEKEEQGEDSAASKRNKKDVKRSNIIDEQVVLVEAEQEQQEEEDEYIIEEIVVEEEEYEEFEGVLQGGETTSEGSGADADTFDDDSTAYDPNAGPVPTEEEVRQRHRDSSQTNQEIGRYSDHSMDIMDDNDACFELALPDIPKSRQMSALTLDWDAYRDELAEFYDSTQSFGPSFDDDDDHRHGAQGAPSLSSPNKNNGNTAAQPIFSMDKNLLLGEASINTIGTTGEAPPPQRGVGKNNSGGFVRGNMTRSGSGVGVVRGVARKNSGGLLRGVTRNNSGGAGLLLRGPPSTTSNFSSPSVSRRKSGHLLAMGPLDTLTEDNQAEQEGSLHSPKGRHNEEGEQGKATMLRADPKSPPPAPPSVEPAEASGPLFQEHDSNEQVDTEKLPPPPPPPPPDSDDASSPSPSPSPSSSSSSSSSSGSEFYNESPKTNEVLTKQTPPSLPPAPPSVEPAEGSGPLSQEQDSNEEVVSDKLPLPPPPPPPDSDDSSSSSGSEFYNESPNNDEFSFNKKDEMSTKTTKTSPGEDITTIAASTIPPSSSPHSAATRDAKTSAGDDDANQHDDQGDSNKPNPGTHQNPLTSEGGSPSRSSPRRPPVAPTSSPPPRQKQQQRAPGGGTLPPPPTATTTATTSRLDQLRRSYHKKLSIVSGSNHSQMSLPNMYNEIHQKISPQTPTGRRRASSASPRTPSLRKSGSSSSSSRKIARFEQLLERSYSVK